MGGRVDKRMDRCVGTLMDKWDDEWISVGIDGRKDRWEDGWMKGYLVR